MTGGPEVDDRHRRGGHHDGTHESVMAIKTPSPSIFRPEGGVDKRAEVHKALIAEIDRRKILRGAVSVSAL